MKTSAARSGVERRRGETAATFVLLGLLSIMAVAYAARILMLARENVDRPDFSHYYTSSYMLRRGIDPYAVDMEPTARELGLELPDLRRATNPPALVLLLEPLTLFRPHLAYWIWFAINVGFLAAFIVLAIIETGVSARIAWGLVCLTLMYSPVAIHFRYAQAQIMILAVLMLALRFLRQERDWAAGAMIAAATLLKIFPIIIVGYLLARRRWKTLATTAGWTAIGLALTIWATGVDTNLNFLRVSRLITRPNWITRSANVSINGLVTRSIGFIVASGASRAWIAAILPTVLCLEICGFAMTLIVSARSASRERTEAAAFALWVVAAIILAPTAWDHYLVLLLIPFWLIAASAAEGHAARAIVWAASAAYFSSYVIIYAIAQAVTHPVTEIVKFAIFESSFVPASLAYLATYWLMRSEAYESTQYRADAKGCSEARQRRTFPTISA